MLERKQSLLLLRSPLGTGSIGCADFCRTVDRIARGHDISESADAAPASHPAGRQRIPTIYDIAKASGVSPSTVSRALSKPGRLSEETEKRIRSVAEQLGYRLNPMARALPTGRTGTLAILVADITNPVYFDVVRGAERVTAKNGLTLIFAESQGSPALEFETAQRLQTAVDGIFLASTRLPDDLITDLASVKPLVITNRSVPGISAIIPDSGPGIAAALDQLHERGHRRIAYVAGREASWIDHIRWETIFEGAVEREMSIVEIKSTEPTREGGAEALDRVLAAGVTATFAYNDMLALGLLQEARKRGLDMPRRLSVVGFDDMFGADLPTPALSTIRTPLGEVGEAAVSRLLRQIAGSADEAEQRLVTSFVSRESVADLRPTGDDTHLVIG